MRYAVLVTGPAGAGKSTFSSALMTHLRTAKRTGHLVNLDPAANSSAFEYEPAIDIRDLISLDDVMDELGYGPNGGLVYCFEYLLQNMDWLEEELGGYDDDYLIFDCPVRCTERERVVSPGQIELYTHHPFLPTLVRQLNRLGLRTCGVYLIESQFMEDKYKFFSGVLSAMSAMVNLEIPWINVMSKMDLVTSNSEDSGSGRNGIRTRKDIARFLDPDPLLLVSAPGSHEAQTERNSRFHALNQAIVQLIEDHPLVSFLPLDLTNPDSIETVLSHIDYTMQYGEDEEPKELRPSISHGDLFACPSSAIQTTDLGILQPADLDEGDFADME
ncbi:GPN-loop GTPase 3 [Grifola frondosa]|uniref:GPN-loop GTPase 3 n=1 Tax=Grifola frondosa TaxID=5627 RepID=A0A1C7MNI7_GRIFR|nr:GPN-loop GTPase 3 [Grifola frondosa]